MRPKCWDLLPVGDPQLTITADDDGSVVIERRLQLFEQSFAQTALHADDQVFAARQRPSACADVLIG